MQKEAISAHEVLTRAETGGYYDEVIDDVVAWFPIPSFDEILEANKDVLERIKEKGDCHDSKERIL